MRSLFDSQLRATARGILVCTLATIMSVFFVSCAARHYYTPDDAYWREEDTLPIAEPDSRSPLLEWETIKRTVFDQIEQGADPARQKE